MTIIKRIGATHLALLIGVDQLAQTVLVYPFAILGLAPVPDPDETISAHVGRQIEDGKIWAIVPGRLIDALFLILTGTRNHCFLAAVIERRLP